MSEPRRCPQCDAEIPVNSPAGLCPRCLLKASTDSQSEKWEGKAPAELGLTKITPPASGFIPPTVEELAPLFPQLEILELLGKGGMGAVYKARQPGLDRLVAIKILPSEISHDPAFAERFQREARALARLSHPHIVAVYDFGQADSARRGSPDPAARPTEGLPSSSKPQETFGQSGGSVGDRPQRDLCYIVMEFVDGANLRQAIQTKTLTPAEALAIVPQICEALQFAHDEGIVHRDIKPENILIDKRGRVKIADFGLAKLLGADAGDQLLTATHQVMGTLRYMAPEQMQGSREVDHRADIYSLGVVFYEVLTGELPMGRFAPPSKRVQVDVRLDEVVLRTLEQDPEQRYQHASEVKTDVDAISRDSQPLNRAAQKPAHQDGRTALAEPVSLPFEIAESVHWGLFGEVHGKLRLGNNELIVEFEVRSLFPAFRSGLKEVSIPFDDIESVNWDGWDLTLHTKTMKALAEIPKSSHGQVAFDLSMTDLDVPGGISEPVKHFLACLPRRMVAESAGVTHPSTRESPTEPRFSRFAIAGAVWALFGLLAIIPTLYFIGLNRVWNGTALPTDVIHSEPPLVFSIFMGALLAIGSGAPIGTTIYGAIAIGHIKRSGGKIIGLPLAVADVLFFPLLVLSGLIAALVAQVGYSMAPHPNAAAVTSAGAIGLLVALAVCFFVARVAWRAISRQDKQIVEMPGADSSLRGAQTADATKTVATRAQESLPYLLGWLVHWLLQERWFVAILQTATALIYAACLIAFFSFQSTNTQTPDGSLTKFQVGQPSAWLTLDGSNSGMHVRFEFLTLTHFVALFGVASLTAYRWLERRHSGKVHSMVWHYVIWGLFFVGASGFGMKIMADSTQRRLTLMTSTNQFAPPPPLGTITSGIGAEFTVPAGQVATFEIVTRRDNETVAIPSHCAYVMASPDKPEAGVFYWTPITKDHVAGSHRNYRIELRTASGGGGFSEATLLPDELNAEVGARGLGLGTLEPSEEVIHWGTLDASNLPANGLIGLLVTVVPHGLNKAGTGIAHIDWKKSQTMQSTTRRKLP